MHGFQFDGNRLVITTDLDLDSEPRFREACERFLEVPGEELVLDLVGVGFIGSAFFGQMFNLHSRLQRQGRSLLVRIPPRQMSIMELLGLPKILRVEAVVPPAADEEAS